MKKYVGAEIPAEIPGFFYARVYDIEAHVCIAGCYHTHRSRASAQRCADAMLRQLVQEERNAAGCKEDLEGVAR